MTPVDFGNEDAHTRELVQAAGVGLWDWNLLTDVVSFSPEWLRQLGDEAGELPAHPDSWVERLHPRPLGRSDAGRWRSTRR